MVTVKSYGSRAEAELAKELLARADIASFVSADDQGGMFPSMAFSKGVSLQVGQRDIERARSVLDRDSLR